MSERYTPYAWADNESGGTPITAARLNALEAGAAALVPVNDIDAAGTPSSATTLLGDGTWADLGNAVRSIVGDALVEGTGITISVDSGTGDITINATGGGSVPDATTTVKGLIQLAGDLAGTAAAPEVAKIAGADISPSPGTPSGSTFLRGDGVWATPPSGGGGGVSAPVVTDWSYRGSNRSGSAFAWKGNQFTPDADVDLYAIAFYGTVVPGATYQAGVATATGSGATPGTVASIVKSATVTMPTVLASTDGGWIWLHFDTPVRLTTGATYGLMVGRTDASGTYGLPLPYNGQTGTENAVPMPGLSHGRTWRFTVANPDIGAAIDRITTNSIGAGYMFALA